MSEGAYSDLEDDLAAYGDEGDEEGLEEAADVVGAAPERSSARRLLLQATTFAVAVAFGVAAGRRRGLR